MSANDPDNGYDHNERFERGLAVRTAVLGETHVHAALASARANAEDALQQLVTEFAWGTVWTRPALERKQRSLATVSMLIALNRPHELAGHIRGALTNGVTRDELRELATHASVYCGFPAAIDASRKMTEVFAQIDGQ